jgi:hypothetical protein
VRLTTKHYAFMTLIAIICWTVLARGSEAAFSITISTPQAVVKGGTEVKVNILLKNTSGHELAVAKALGEVHGEISGYRVDVWDSNGRRLRRTKYGATVEGDTDVLGPFSLRTKILQPDTTLNDSLIISKLYDLSKPGKYTIQVYRVDHENKSVVKSNLIKLTVSP